MDRIRFAESPFEGHPDKLADIISDEILDEFMRKDPFSRVSINVLLSSNIVFIAGEVSSSAYVDLQMVSKKAIKEVGYTKPEYGFDGDLIGVISSINEQSPEIALCIASEGAGDSAIVVGYATDETESFLPAPIYYAHKISKTTSDFRKKGIMPFLRPDGKTIVGIKYEDQNKFYIDSINMFVQHDPDISLNHLRELIFEDIIKKHIPSELLRKETKIKINPAGRFIIGGPVADTGMTGRKIVSDAYGDISFSGGSAFSGKDPTKTDRAASYMARYIAKHIVAAGWAKKVLIQIAYAFGVKEPIGFDIETFGTETKPVDLIKSRIREVFSLYPKDIIETLDLRKPIYKKTACYGHFGKEGLSWEKLDKLEYFS
jgi:methionine adenosyltransferase (EC 2.5.1.6)